jgi:RimJ/RimL family protein N-acetyltransferase
MRTVERSQCTDLTGEKVILRCVEEQDREMLISLIQDPETIKITGGYPCPETYDHQMSWFDAPSDLGGNVRRIIADKAQPQNGLGIIAFSGNGSQKQTAQIYIKLIKSARNRGYGQDAVRVFVSYGFHELQLNRIFCRILEHNTASRKLFEKCGFCPEGLCKDHTYKYVLNTPADLL